MSPTIGTFDFQANFQIPDGSVISKAIVYGDDSNDTWILYRVDNNGNAAALANGTFNTEVITITNNEVDNENFSYMFQTGNIAQNDLIHRARITYTI